MRVVMHDDCNKELYGEVIAGYIIGISAARSFSGNYITDFEEINETFGTNLPEDKEMLDHITGAILKRVDIVSDLIATENFDIMLYTSFCPFYDEED